MAFSMVLMKLHSKQSKAFFKSNLTMVIMWRRLNTFQVWLGFSSFFEKGDQRFVCSKWRHEIEKKGHHSHNWETKMS